MQITGITLLGLSFYKGSPNLMITSIGAMFFLLGAFGTSSSLIGTDIAEIRG
jgi:hypothetical protein